MAELSDATRFKPKDRDGMQQSASKRKIELSESHRDGGLGNAQFCPKQNYEEVRQEISIQQHKQEHSESLLYFLKRYPSIVTSFLCTYMKHNTFFLPL